MLRTITGLYLLFLEKFPHGQKEMTGLNSQRITGHEFLTNDVHVTTYEDGTRVYVNYGNTEYAKGKVKVPAREYLVERGSAE